MKKRIVAANRVVMPDIRTVTLGVVEIEGNCVCSVSRLDGEQPFTEWIGGTIRLVRSADGALHAYKGQCLLTA